LSSSQIPVQMQLQVSAGEEADRDELDRLTRQLLVDLSEIEIESAGLLKTGDVPEGAKTAEALSIGTLAVAVLPVFFPKLIDFLQAWTMRGGSRSVKIKTQVGDRAVEVEYSPDKMSRGELMEIVKTILAATEDQ
jgi:hypothetical protein